MKVSEPLSLEFNSKESLGDKKMHVNKRFCTLINCISLRAKCVVINNDATG